MPVGYEPSSSPTVFSREPSSVPSLGSDSGSSSLPSPSNTPVTPERSNQYYSYDSDDEVESIAMSSASDSEYDRDSTPTPTQTRARMMWQSNTGTDPDESDDDGLVVRGAHLELGESAAMVAAKAAVNVEVDRIRTALDTLLTLDGRRTAPNLPADQYPGDRFANFMAKWHDVTWIHARLIAYGLRLEDAGPLLYHAVCMHAEAAEYDLGAHVSWLVGDMGDYFRAQAEALRAEAHELGAHLDAATQSVESLKQENNTLRAQLAQETQRRERLEQMIATFRAGVQQADGARERKRPKTDLGEAVRRADELQARLTAESNVRQNLENMLARLPEDVQRQLLEQNVQLLARELPDRLKSAML